MPVVSLHQPCKGCATAWISCTWALTDEKTVFLIDSFSVLWHFVTTESKTGRPVWNPGCIVEFYHTLLRLSLGKCLWLPYFVWTACGKWSEEWVKVMKAFCSHTQKKRSMPCSVCSDSERWDNHHLFWSRLNFYEIQDLPYFLWRFLVLKRECSELHDWWKVKKRPKRKVKIEFRRDNSPYQIFVRKV